MIRIWCVFKDDEKPKEKLIIVLFVCQKGLKRDYFKVKII